MKRPEHFPENILSFKMSDVPAEWQDRTAICQQLCLKEERQEGGKEGGKYMVCLCINMHVRLCTKNNFF